MSMEAVDFVLDETAPANTYVNADTGMIMVTGAAKTPADLIAEMEADPVWCWVEGDPPA